MDDPAEVWEQRYAASDRVWSGRPNAALVDIATALAPGRALDLGCGEGADAIWLSQHGWTVTGIDIAPSAIAHARAAAEAIGLTSEQAAFVVGDLESLMDAPHTPAMPQPADDLAALSLPPDLWEVELAEVRRRDAVGPDGRPAVLDDGIVLVRRR